MSDQSQGPGWWLASDGRWYPPEQAPGADQATDPTTVPNDDVSAPTAPAVDAAPAQPTPPVVPPPGAPVVDAPPSSPPQPTPTSASTPPAPGWWLASDGNWYAPEQATAPTAPPTGPNAVVSAPLATQPTTPTASVPSPVAPPAPTAATSTAASAPAAPGPKRSIKGPLLAVGAVALVIAMLAAGLSVYWRGRGKLPTNAVPMGVDEVPSSDVTLADDTVVVRSNNGSAVKEISGDGGRIVLDAGAEGASDLASGKVMVLTGVTAVKAKNVERQGDTIIVTTAPAALTDVLSDGHISWEPKAADLSKAVLRVSEPTAASLETSAGPLVQRVPTAGEGEMAAGYIDIPIGEAFESADGNVSSEGDIGDYHYRFDARISGDTVNFTLNLSTDQHGVRIAVDVDASVSGVSFGGDIDISASSVRNFQLAAPNLRGRAHITASAATNDEATQIPVSLMHLPMSVQIPFPLAGIPFTVGIDADAEIQLAFSSRGANVSGSFDANFDGNGTMTVSNGSMTTGGAFNANWEDPLAAVEGFSISPAALIVTIQFPKVSLGLGVGPARASAYLEAVYSFAPTISGSSNFTPCRAEPVSQRVTAGMTGEFFGHEVQLAERVIAARDDAPYDPPTAVCRI